jgi:predicted RNA-binding protein YlxR (DUF448 family)
VLESAFQDANRRREAHAATPVERRCIVTGEVRPKGELLRFAIGPDGTVVPDMAGTLPGRGLWIAARRELVERASRRNAFAKAARAPVRVPTDLPDRVEQALRRRCLDLLGLANRAGQAVAGYHKVRAWLIGGQVGLLLQAGDGALGSRERLRALGEGRHPGLPVSTPLTAAELGTAFGRDACVHVAVAPGGLADRLMTEVRRLQTYAAALEQRRVSAQR